VGLRSAYRRARYGPPHRAELALLAKYRDHTMLPEQRFVDSLGLARVGVAAGPGDIVECGTWRGGMSAAMAEHVGDAEHLSVLFDSFEGLPEPDLALDGERAVASMTDDPALTYDNCRSSEEDARAAMAISGRPYRLERGWFDDTVTKYAKEQRPIAVLRLDGDWYDSTILCLRELFGLVIPGGVVIVDDYVDWPGCSRAVHDFLSEAQRPEPIMSTGAQTYLTITRSPPSP